MASSPLPKISTQGFDALDRQLADLSDKVRGSTLRAGVRKAAKPVLDKARATIPVGQVEHKTYKGRLVAPGFSSRNIRMVVRVTRDKQMAFALLGVAKEAFYAVQWVEFGVPAYGIAPRGWLVPAMRSTREQQVKLLGEALYEGIQKAVRSNKR